LVWQYDAVGNQTCQENRADPPMTASITWTCDAAGRILTRQADSITNTSTRIGCDGQMRGRSSRTFARG
jgi:hypothetical protein